MSAFNLAYESERTWDLKLQLFLLEWKTENLETSKGLWFTLILIRWIELDHTIKHYFSNELYD